MTTDRRDDAGVTLIELLVTIMILSIVSLMLFTFMSGVTSVTARTERHVQAEQDGQLLLRKMTEEIRAADPILDAAGCSTGFADCLRFEVNRTTAFSASCVRRSIAYKLDRVARRIVRETTDWVWNAATSSCVPTNAGASRVVMSSVNFAAGTPLFVYTNKAGATPTNANIPKAPRDGGTAAVKVNLVIRYQERGTPDLVLSSNAVLRNNR